jgi:hypothetical protein
VLRHGASRRPGTAQAQRTCVEPDEASARFPRKRDEGQYSSASYSWEGASCPALKELHRAIAGHSTGQRARNEKRGRRAFAARPVSSCGAEDTQAEHLEACSAQMECARVPRSASVEA